MFPRGIYDMKPLIWSFSCEDEEAGNSPTGTMEMEQYHSPAFLKKRELSSSAIRKNNRFNKTILY